MHPRTSLLLIIALLGIAPANAQQITLSWATETVPANNRLRTAVGGGAFLLGTGSNSAVIQRVSAAGSILWTKTLQAPTLYAIDMDVDGSNNIYVYVGFTTGQLDLDPGPGTTLVNPGKVYAKYNSNGQFQWGFSIENSTDLSEDYGAVSVDDAGNLYICGDLSQGTYDFDPGPGTYNLTCGDFTIGAFVARYRPDGTLVFADVRTWYSGFSSSRDIAVMRDGTFFYVVQSLDNGGPLSGQIDVDPGPGVFNVYTETQNLLRYDSLYNFQGQAYANFGDMRMCVDQQGAVYIMGGAAAGSGLSAVKFNGSGPNLNQVYSTSLYVNGNVREGDIAPDEQGGCLGMYSLNSLNSTIRFYKMDVSGLVDFNLYINSGSDWTYPGGKGFDIDGGSFYLGTYNNNYLVDYDPGPGVANHPVDNANDGVVARYQWCEGAPFDVLGITAASPACVGDTVTFAAEVFGDAESYEWSVEAPWQLISGQGTTSIDVLVGAGSAMVSVTAMNDCGSSAPMSVEADGLQVIAELPPDELWCYGYNGVLDPGACPGCSYLWQPGGETTPTLNVSITETTTFGVTVSDQGCIAEDEITITIDPCLAVGDAAVNVSALRPSLLHAGEPLTLGGVTRSHLDGLYMADGRQVSTRIDPAADGLLIDTSTLQAGAYLVRAVDGRAWRFVVE